MTRKEQLFELRVTVKCKLAPSSIHGIGVFAIRNVEKGERLYCRPELGGMNAKWFDLTYSAVKELPEEISELIIGRWPNIVNNKRFLSPNFDQRLLSFMNHSDTPNYDENTDIASRDIKIGEEITENYRNMPNWEIVFPWLKNSISILDEPYFSASATDRTLEALTEE